MKSSQFITDINSIAGEIGIKANRMKNLIEIVVYSKNNQTTYMLLTPEQAEKVSSSIDITLAKLKGYQTTNVIH